MPNPNISQLQSVGDFAMVLLHPLVSGGAAVSLVGFKVEGDVIDSDQIIDNSKVVPLIGGLNAIIVNRIVAGTLRFNAVRTTGDPAQGDIIAICHFLQLAGDNVGGTLRVSWGQNGVTKSITFAPVVVKRCKAVHIMGNDVAEYGVELTYGGYSET